MLPLGLYIHLPWCVRKCPYCDFNSHARRDAVPEDDYVTALTADLEAILPQVWGRPVASVYFGGGTPSLFSADAIGRIVAMARARLMLAPDCEITLEANPGTVEHDRFEGYRAAGVNRISLGVQSFDNDMLQRLGRIHDGSQAQAAIAAVRQAGFDNFNIDLMHGLPGQAPAQALADVRQALEFAPPHLSHYQLTIEPNTAFAASPPVLPDDDALSDIQDEAHELLATTGYDNYEVSAWAQPGRQARHNLNYWLFGDYLGIGAGAHGKITDLATGAITRYARKRHPQAYLRAVADGEWNADVSQPSTDDLRFEYFFNGLRLRRGVSLAALKERTGLNLSQVEPALAEAEQRGLLERADDHVRATDLGWRFMNDLQALFLPERGPNG
ncbi:MAG: radical SAM family heme chaperone HemW [Wenzhouxiangellaceae bacterium]